VPRYEVRLEAPDDSGHFRITRLTADSAEAAQKHCERKELELVIYQLSAPVEAAMLKAHKADSLDDLPFAAPLDADDEEKAAFRKLDAGDRAKLNAHRQDEPYKVVSVDEVGE
jgi:hypothetical protein